MTLALALTISLSLTLAVTPTLNLRPNGHSDASGGFGDMANVNSDGNVKVIVEIQR